MKLRQKEAKSGDGDLEKTARRSEQHLLASKKGENQALEKKLRTHGVEKN